SSSTQCTLPSRSASKTTPSLSSGFECTQEISDGCWTSSGVVELLDDEGNGVEPKNENCRHCERAEESRQSCQQSLSEQVSSAWT
ncbi:hypothetical protein RTBOTA2_002295, partial [Rhodotorula toruloides]